MKTITKKELDDHNEIDYIFPDDRFVIMSKNISGYNGDFKHNIICWGSGKNKTKAIKDAVKNIVFYNIESETNIYNINLCEIYKLV